MQILLTIAYDGTEYAGWQRQTNAVTVQEKLEDALAQVLGRQVSTVASSRTDAGVHALGQRVAFDATGLKIPTDKLPQVLNSLLPRDIAVQYARMAKAGFNPRFAARRKTYQYSYSVSPAPNPLAVRYSAHVPHSLDIAAMKQAAACFVGTHDFAGFCATGGSAKTTVREIFSCDITQESDMLQLRICGEGFLYNMVRIIAGTVLYVGMGKLQAADIPNIIAAKQRDKAGKTMPPHGLTLVSVEF
jgi:tRNA pseudouridine38-40 synthase